MARYNNYNRYSQPYVENISGASFAYQPTFDPAEHQMLVEALDRSQKRYDIGRQTASEFAGQVGGMQTYAPDLLNERVNDFNKRVQNVVSTQYGGDWGLAANDIVDMISKEKQNPFYKLNAMQVKAAEEIRQAKLRNPNTFFENYGSAPINSSEYLQKAVSENNMAAFDDPQFGYAPEDRQAIAAKMIEGVPTDVTERLLTELNPEDVKILEEKLGAGAANKIFRSLSVETNKPKIDLLRDNFVDMMLEKDPTLIKQYGEEGARKKAAELIDKTIPMFYKYREQEQLRDFTPQNDGDENTESLYRPVLTVKDGLQPKPTTVNSDEVNEVYGGGSKGVIGEFLFPGLETLNNELKDLETNPKYQENAISRYATKNAIKAKKEEIEKLKKSKKYKEFEEKKKLIDQKTNEFESLYGKIEQYESSKDKANFVAKLEDNYYNQSYSILSPFNFNKNTNLVDDINYQLKSTPGALINIEKFDTDDGNWVPLDRKESATNFDLSTQRKNVSVSNFSFAGISPYDARIRAVGSDNDGNISYYPSEQAEKFGEAIKASSDRIRKNGFSVDNALGMPMLHIKTYDKSYEMTNDKDGALTDEVIPIPEEYLEKARSIETKAEAQKLYNELRYKVNTYDRRSSILNYIDANAESLGYLTKRK